MLTDSETELQDMLEFLHDGDLHQNVIETLPPQFKARVESPVLQRRSLKRVYQLVDHENKLQHMPKTVQYRDPNLRGVQLKPQIRVVPPQKIMKTLPNMKVVKNGENFVPYGKLYRTVLKNGKAIQTPVVTPTNDMKFKTTTWQKQRQLQVTQGNNALKGATEMTRKQIMKLANYLPNSSDENQNPEVKAEPIDDDGIAQVVEFDDQPLTQVLSRNTNSNNNRGSYASDEEMTVIDCSQGNGNNPVTVENSDLSKSEKRERLPYSVLPRRHVCNICDKKFVRPAELERHFRIHTGEKPFKCSVCDQEFTRKCHLTKHMITHDNKQYYCTMCKFKTIRPDTFRRHLKDHSRFSEQNTDALELNQLSQDATVEIITEDQFDMNDGTSAYESVQVA